MASTMKYTQEIQLISGKIRGLISTLSTGDEVRKYLGIPFANAKRFELPVLPIIWSDVKNMTSLGKACMQIQDDISRLDDMSEDCLNLNVFVPHSSTKVPALPVMVWIYGDSFQVNSNKLYDGSYIATMGKVIVVAINYRLGAFGFLATGKDTDLKGNYGMYDQIKALEWVKDNIAGFGGDPKNVTIFGNSAGGVFVSLLCLSPLADGLFQNAIMQSGVANANWVLSTYNEAVKKTTVLGKNLNCSDIGKLKSCLDSKTSAEILNALTSVDFEFGSPVIDGTFLLDHPNILLERGQFQKRNTLLGVANDDGSSVTDAIPELSRGLPISSGVNRGEFVSWISEEAYGLARMLAQTKPPFLKPFGKAMIYRYTNWTHPLKDRLMNRRMFMEVTTDSLYTAPTIAHANAFAKKNATTYFYQIEHHVNQGVSRYFKVPS
ncbi:hypothetical protein QZH41_005182 [Actinostola sp. cb2023]|nr:hypothetical protein QZH41_005182 [Actinostola sp. cb2023]